MKKILPFLLFTFIAFSIFAQDEPTLVKETRIHPALPQPSPMPMIQGSGEVPEPTLQMRDEEVNIGITRFELQTIASLGRRVAVAPNGQVSAAWLHGLDQTGGWPDRGAAYNQHDGSAWGTNPDFSLEATRSGYPSFTSSPTTGMEVVFSHKNTSATQWFLQVHTKMPSETTWTETEIPSTVTGGPVWGKVAMGGPDGNTIHAVAVSVAPDFGGVIYEGMNQHPLYYRSLDGGANWDKVDVIIPGLDSNFYSSVGGEAYNIYAYGETVAIGVFDAWGDIAVFKSIDNGENWTKFIVKDHPLDKYDGSGYAPGDVPFDPNVPDSTSIFSSDDSGSVLVDDNGKVHVFYSVMYHNAADGNFGLIVQFNDGSLIYDGIAYWNEDFETDELQIIATAQDMDGDSVVIVSDYGGVRYTNANFTSFPTSSIDDDGNIYMVYTSMREDLNSFEETTYRHVFIVKSSDGGQTWSDPFDLINLDVTEFYDFIEGAYPSIPARIGDQIHMVYQQDFDPGLTPTGANVAEQFIMHVPYDKETFEPSFTHNIPQLNGEVVMAPNPTKGDVQIRFDLNELSDAAFAVFDLLGRLVYFDEMERLPVGQNAVSLDLSQLNKGMYLVQMEIDGMQLSKKVIIER